MATSPKNSGRKAKDLSFEEALKKLESIVASMENEDLPLQTMLALYEEGTQLVKVCQDKLQEAELKIQKLEEDADGALKLKPIEPDATPDEPLT